MQAAILSLGAEEASAIVALLSPRDLRRLRAASPVLWKISAGGTHLRRLCITHRADLGEWISELRNLDEFVLGDSLDSDEDPLIDTSWIYLLPKTLRVLRLLNATSNGMLLRTLTQQERGSIFDSYGITGGDLRPIHLDLLFPALQVFEMARMGNEHGKQLLYYRSISQGIFDSILWSYSSILDFLEHLPASLTDCSVVIPRGKAAIRPLKLMKGSFSKLRIMSEYVPSQVNRLPHIVAFQMELPQELESLELEGWHTLNYVELLTLPKSLTWLSLPCIPRSFFVQCGLHTDELYRRGSQADMSQYMPDEALEQVIKDGASEGEVIAPIEQLTQLQYLEIDGCECPLLLKWLNKLPRALRTLKLKNMWLRGEGAVSWPPLLTALTVESVLMSHPPPDSWNETIRYPDSLTYLVLQSNNNYYAMTDMPPLPKNLTHLELHGCDILEFHLSLLPSGIKTLALEFDNIEGDLERVISQLAPSVEELHWQLAVCPAEILHSAPPTLKRIYAPCYSIDLPSFSTVITALSAPAMLQLIQDYVKPIRPNLAVHLSPTRLDARIRLYAKKIPDLLPHVSSINMQDLALKQDKGSSAVIHSGNFPALERLSVTFMKKNIIPHSVQHLKFIENPLSHHPPSLGHLNLLTLHAAYHTVKSDLPASLTDLHLCDTTPAVLSRLSRLTRLTLVAAKHDAASLISDANNLTDITIHLSSRSVAITHSLNPLPAAKLSRTLRSLVGNVQVRLSDALNLPDLCLLRVDSLVVDAQHFASVAPQQCVDMFPSAMCSFLPQVLAHLGVSSRVSAQAVLLEHLDVPVLNSMLSPGARAIFFSELPDTIKSGSFEWANRYTSLNSLEIAQDVQNFLIHPVIWPSSLSSLSIPCGETSKSTQWFLPAALVHLTLFTEGSAPEFLPPLPKTLSSLTIRASAFSSRSLAILPITLKALTLQSSVQVFQHLDAPPTEEVWPPLPPFLTSLTLISIPINSIPANLASVIPVECTKISISENIIQRFVASFRRTLYVPSQRRDVNVEAISVPSTLAAYFARSEYPSYSREDL